MKRKIELLAPGGDIDSIKAAIIAGADAIYCGLDKFNARNRASNLSFDELNGVLRLAHKFNCEVFLTLNVVILEQELKALFKLLNQLVNTTLDGIIVQDLGLFNLVKKYFPTLDIHASNSFNTVVIPAPMAGIVNPLGIKFFPHSNQVILLGQSGQILHFILEKALKM